MQIDYFLNKLYVYGTLIQNAKFTKRYLSVFNILLTVDK